MDFKAVQAQINKSIDELKNLQSKKPLDFDLIYLTSENKILYKSKIVSVEKHTILGFNTGWIKVNLINGSLILKNCTVKEIHSLLSE